MRRNRIRKASFLLALFAALLAWGLSASAQAKKYKTQVRVSQERALLQACEYLDSLQTTLQKAGYAASPQMLSSVSAQLRTQADGAAAALSALSAGETQLYNVFKFLTQAACFTDALGARASAGEEITSAERGRLRELFGYAQSLSRQFGYMAGLLDAGLFSFEALDEALLQTNAAAADMADYPGAAADAEESVKDFPTLIYDGPYSDHITQKHSRLLASLSPVSQTKARLAASEVLCSEPHLLTAANPVAGRIPAYVFYNNGAYAAVTLNGALPVYALSDYTAGEAVLSRAEAMKKAAEYLEKIGYTNMAATYSADENGVCIVNFAYRAGEYICYPDLIKVGVSLSDGRITSMDARDYIMNHVEREIPAEALTPAAAAEKAAEGLAVKRVARAVIPTGGGFEKFAYELRCTAADGQDVLVYVDTTTGQEDDILLLLYADGGTLTK